MKCYKYNNYYVPRYSLLVSGNCIYESKRISFSFR